MTIYFDVDLILLHHGLWFISSEIFVRVFTFGQFQFIIFIVSVNPYFIDISGRDISNDIQNAIDEVQGMAVNGLNRLTQGDRNSGPFLARPIQYRS